MELFQLLQIIANWSGWPAVVVALLLAISYGYWLLTTKNNMLKDEIKFLEKKIFDLHSYRPDILAKSLADRVKILTEELERLHQEKQVNIEQITEKEIKLENAKSAIAELNEHLEQANKTLRDVSFDLEISETTLILGRVEAIIESLEQVIELSDQPIGTESNRKIKTGITLLLNDIVDDINLVFLELERLSHTLYIAELKFVKEEVVNLKNNLAGSSFVDTTYITERAYRIIHPVYDIKSNISRWKDNLRLDTQVVKDTPQHNNSQKEKGKLSDLSKGNDLIFIDSSPLLGKLGKRLEFSYSQFSSVREFLDTIWAEHEGLIPSFTYDEKWILLDVDTRKVFSNLGHDWAHKNNKSFDDRSLHEIGINPGMKFQLIPFQKNQ